MALIVSFAVDSESYEGFIQSINIHVIRSLFSYSPSF